MTNEEAAKTLLDCEACGRCVICTKVADAFLDAIELLSKIVHCHECAHFSISSGNIFGWCKECRCKKKPDGFCEQGIRREGL